MRQSKRDYNRIVVKIGSSLLFYEKMELNHGFFRSISEQVNNLFNEGREIILVSSGAIAFGINALNLKKRPKELYLLQAAAAIGQNRLMYTYQRIFGRRVHVAQILLTRDDFNDRRRYLNAKNTICTLLKYGSIPIVNENDTVSTDEIKFGDNDRLSAMVASLISADILIILSDVDGLIDRQNKIVNVVDKITPQIKALACFTDREVCVGGMVTKIEAAKIAVDSGIPCVIANGYRKNIIELVLKEPFKYGTLFLPKETLAARKRWIAFATEPQGKIVVDEGAKSALINKKSLLSVGVVAVEGDFEEGDVVSVVDVRQQEFARGKVGFSRIELEKVKGKRYPKEVIHCDNIVIL
ncbi:MAG: glutamate 5-kinase [Candidatus Omnitrophica bacterium]|nr:glutamate 5-kinase [Candidatus Omnitrophota bacterium]